LTQHLLEIVVRGLSGINFDLFHKKKFAVNLRIEIVSRSKKVINL